MGPTSLQYVWQSEVWQGILGCLRQGAEVSGFGSSPGRLTLEGPTDEVLISQVSGGDERALSELYDRYGGLIYGAGIRYLGDSTLAEDLVQDVFVSVWRSAAIFDPSRASFATWIYRITRNRATDLARRRQVRMRLVAPSHEPFPEPDEADRTEEIVKAFDVVRILSELSEPHRQVLVLAYFEGLSQREISDRIGTPLGTVKSRTSAALRAARQRMFRKAADEPRNKTSEGQLEDG